MAGTRVSQHYAQVVGTPDQSSSELRVQRLYAEVLISGASDVVIHDETVNETLNITDDAIGLLDIQRTSDTLNITDEVSKTSTFNRQVSDTIAANQEAARVREANATSNLSISDLVSEFNYVADRNPAGNTLNLSHTVFALSALPAANTLNLTQTVNVRAPYKLLINQPLSVSDSASTPITYRLTVSDPIPFISIARTTRNLSANNTLNLVQDLPIGKTDSTLNLTQSVAWGFHFDLSQNVGITDSMTVQATFIRSVSDDDFVGHALTWYRESPCAKKQYTPFQGESTITDTFTDPDVTLMDAQGDTGNFSVYTPYLGVPTSKVTLRDPELDNRDRNAYTRINTETRGGRIIVFADPNWPKVRTLAVTIIGITEDKVDEFQTFMQATVGQEIGLTDWEGRVWKGFITNPNETATQDGRDMWTITFEFEGEILDVQQPESNNGSGMSLNLTDAATVVKI